MGCGHEQGTHMLTAQWHSPWKGEACRSMWLMARSETQGTRQQVPASDSSSTQRPPAAALTQAFGCLASKVHSIQTHSTLGGSHVQSHIKSVRNIVMHALLKTPIKFWRKKKSLQIITVP